MFTQVVFINKPIFEANLTDMPCADPESYARRGPTLRSFYFYFIFYLLFFCEGREDPSSTKSRPSSTLKRNAI